MRPEPEAGAAAYGVLEHLHVTSRVGRVTFEACGFDGLDGKFIMTAARFLDIEIEICGVDALAYLLAAGIERRVLA